jgi:hypothetical protein
METDLEKSVEKDSADDVIDEPYQEELKTILKEQNSVLS